MLRVLINVLFSVNAVALPTVVALSLNAAVLSLNATVFSPNVAV